MPRGFYEAVTRSAARQGNGQMLTTGSKAQVWHGTALHTSGGLYKKDLMMYKNRIVSRRKHELGMQAFKKLPANSPFRMNAQKAKETGGASLRGGYHRRGGKARVAY